MGQVQRPRNLDQTPLRHSGPVSRMQINLYRFGTPLGLLLLILCIVISFGQMSEQLSIAYRAQGSRGLSTVYNCVHHNLSGCCRGSVEGL